MSTDLSQLESFTSQSSSYNSVKPPAPMSGGGGGSPMGKKKDVCNEDSPDYNEEECNKGKKNTSPPQDSPQESQELSSLEQ